MEFRRQQWRRHFCTHDARGKVLVIPPDLLDLLKKKKDDAAKLARDVRFSSLQ
jgi:hypothetical protein